MDALVFVVRLYTADETICATLTDHHLPPDRHIGPSQKRIHLKSVPLAPGEYFVVVDIVDRKYPVVYSRSHSTLFRVRGTGGPPAQIGALALDAVWQ